MRNKTAPSIVHVSTLYIYFLFIYFFISLFIPPIPNPWEVNFILHTSFIIHKKENNNKMKKNDKKKIKRHTDLNKTNKINA